MSKRVQHIRHTTTDANSFTGLEGEFTYVTDTGEIRAHDGATAGGARLLTLEQLNNLFQPLDADLTALAALDSTGGIITKTGAAAYSRRTLTGPGVGITITNGDGVAGNPTLALANDLSALEALGSTGLAARTGTDTWAQRSIVGTASEITVTNGDGVAGNPALSLPAALTFTGKTVTGGTFADVTISGGDIDADTLKVGGVAVALSTTSVLAGTGMTGGGALSTDRTLSIDKATQANVLAGTANKVVTSDVLKKLTIVAAVKFNGTTGAIIGNAVNVTSVTRGSTGSYAVNLTTALADTNALVLVTSDGSASGRGISGGSMGTTSIVSVTTADGGNTLADQTAVSVVVFAP